MKYYAWALICTSLAIAAFCVVLGSPGAKAWQSGDTYGGSGDWTISNPTIIADETSIVSGNIDIRSGGSLTMYNAGITESLAADGGYTINVASGGTLTVYNSAISSSNTGLHYKFTVSGRLTVNQSTISEMWGDTASYTGGVQLLSGSTVLIENSTVRDGKTVGLYLNNSSPVIRYNSIYNNGLQGSSTYCIGIYAYSDGATSASIHNNRIYNNNYVSGASYYGFGILSHGQANADRITSNDIYDNGFNTGGTPYGYQLYLYSSKPTVSGGKLCNGSYQMFLYQSNPPAMSSIFLDAYVRSTTYQVYLSTSNLTMDKFTFNLAYQAATLYGVYGTSTGPLASFVTLSNSTVNYQVYASYDRNMVRTAGYCPINVYGCTFNSYGGAVRAIYTSGSYSPINASDVNINLNTPTGVAYGVYAGSYSPVNLVYGNFTFTNTPSTTIAVYSSTYSPKAVSYLNYKVTGAASTNYVVYSATYSDCKITGSTFSVAGNVGGTATIYGVYAPSYSNVDITGSSFVLTNFGSATGIYITASSSIGASVNFTKSYMSISNTYYGTNGIQASQYCAINVTASTIDLYNIDYYGSYSNYIINANYYSPLKILNSTLNMTFLPPSTYYPSYPYFYGIYAYYYSNLTMDDSWMNITIGGTGSYPNYPYIYVIYANQYSPINMNRTVINCKLPSGGYYNYVYGIYNQYYCPLNMYDCRYNMTGSGNGQYPMYAYYTYMFDPYQYSDLMFWNCTLNMTINPTGYYCYYTYMFYAQQYCKINFTDTTVIFSSKCPENYYSYYYYVFYTYYSDISLLNSKLWINNCTGYYMYAIYTNYGGFSMENSIYLVSDNRIMYSTYYMMMYGYGSGKLFMNNSKYLIVNDRDWNQYNYKYTYCAYAYDMPTVVLNSTINWELLSQGPYVAPPSLASIYYYGFYGYAYNSQRDYLFVNNTFRVTHGLNASGGWLFMPYYNAMARFSNNYINYTHSSNGGSVWYGTASTRTPYYIDNCTVEYMTKSTQPMRGGIMFNQMSYIDLYVNDTKIFMRNDGGFYPFNMFYYLSYAKVYFYNTSLEYNIGGGDGRWGPGNDASPCGYMQYTDTLKFTNSTYTITTRTEPMLLRSFNYTTGQSGSLIFDNSKMIWNIQSPNTVASFLYFYSQSGGAPGLSVLECKNAQLDMKISGTDSASQMISMAPGAGLSNLKIDKTALSLTVSAVSVNPSTIIYMDGQKGNTLANLLMTVNGPSPAVDPNGVTTITGVQLVKSFPTIDNFTVNCNGQGRVYGIICDVVSIPVITNTKVNNAYAGVWSRFFSQPSFSGCEFRDCKYGVMADTTSNVSMTGCSIINSTIGANVTDRSWLSITECTFTNVAQFPISLSESTAWSLSSKFDKDKVKFNDANSTLIINWLLQVKVTWQNGVVIEGARVTATDTQGGLAVSASSDEKGIVPWFFVTEYIQTNFVVKTFHSPYTVNATIAGLTGSSVVTTDETKEAPVVITDPFDPVVAITAPEDDTYQNFTRVSLVGTATDLGSGIDHLSFSHNGVDWVDVPATKVWELEMVVPEGTWTIQARLYDIAGRMSSAAITLTVDLTAPFITVTDPKDSSLGNRIGVDLVGSVEKGSVFTVNHRPVSIGADGSFRYGLRLVEGKNVFALFARDLAGNTNSTTWTLYLDITPPPLALSGPADGLLTNQKSVAVSGKTEPGAGLKVNDAAAEVKPDGSFSLVFNLNRGPNSILVVASDLAGNTASALRTVVMDDELSLGVAFPEDNLVTNQITILVRGTTDTDALLRLNDGLMTVGPDGNFSVTYTLAEGQNELVFRATDRAGNSASLTRKVVLDTRSPVLEVGTPADGSILRTKEVAVTGICEPGMVLTINGEAAATESGTFSKTLSLPEGTGAISLEGRDQAGNPVSRRLTVLVDITEPSLNIVEPQTGFRTRDLTVMVVGITEPGATVTVNGAAVVVDPFGKFSTGVTLVKGSNTIKVTATDEAGNQKAESVTVKNTVPPGAPASQTWLWSVAGVVLALCIMVPISMLLVNNALREKGRKEGSQ